MEPWIDFGFASCTYQEEEAELAGVYLRLITTCTFDAFCKAYRERRLLDLFHAQGLHVSDTTHLRDLLHGPADMTKSVWHLKQYIMEDAAVQKAVMHSSVMADYGFMNCKNDAEKRMYKAFFDSHRDHAAIQGNLHGFLTKVVQGLRDCKFERLMKNPYPLPGL